jgi:hypothetical protein
MTNVIKVCVLIWGTGPGQWDLGAVWMLHHFALVTFLQGQPTAAKCLLCHASACAVDLLPVSHWQ